MEERPLSSKDRLNEEVVVKKVSGDLLRKKIEEFTRDQYKHMPAKGRSLATKTGTYLEAFLEMQNWRSPSPLVQKGMIRDYSISPKGVELVLGLTWEQARAKGLERVGEERWNLVQAGLIEILEEKEGVEKYN